MQCSNKGSIPDSSVFCQSRLMPKTLKQSEDYSSIPDIISIWITDYNATSYIQIQKYLGS